MSRSLVIAVPLLAVLAMATGGMPGQRDAGDVANLESARPSVRLLSPAPRSVVRGRVVVGYAGVPADATRVVFLVDLRRRWSASAARIVAGKVSGRWDSRTVRNGRHVLALKVTRPGRPAVTTRTVVRVSNPPVSILAPRPGTLRGRVPWTVVVPRGATRVGFAVDGRALTAVGRAPWRVRGGWDSRTVPDGRHTLTAVAARDGRRLGRASVRVTVANGRAGGGGGTGGPGTSSPSVPAGTGFFGPTSVWNAPVPASAPLDPRSDALVADLRRQVASGPWINTAEYSTPIYTVGGDMRKVKITLTNSYRDPKVVAALAAVPIPPDARPASGTDRHLVLSQPSTDTMWEFFGLQGSGDSWSAENAAKIVRVSQSSGVNELVTGATASGLALAGGVVTLPEWASGRIDHALALAIPEPRREWLTRPANRTDGWIDSENAIPEGAHFRLDPTLDIASLNLPPATRMLAEAAQKYGIVVRDKSGAVAFYGEDPTPTGTDPYAALFAPGGAGAVARAFPWDRLQLLKMDLRCCWQVP